MKNLKTQLAVFLLSTLCLLTSAYAQITPLGDSYTNTADPTTNYGSKALLDVDGSSQVTYIQFNLASIPSGASVSQATLKLYVNSVTTAGSFNVDYVNGTWSESTIDYSNAPTLGTTIAASVPLTTADKNQYILVDVTAAVQAWLDGVANDGIALVANSPLNASFDSKENTTTSHPAELDIVFAGIAGVTTASGSGLTGGGTSGTLNLSLTNACAANQVLQWNGSSWVCAAVGTGTITGVTHGTYLTGGGTSGNVTLDLNTTLVPLLVAANTFTGSQTVNGNLSATGVVTGSSYQIGSNLFAFGSVTNFNAFLGFAGNPATTAGFNTAVGFQALGYSTSGDNNTVIGSLALSQSATTGHANTVVGSQAVVPGSTGSGNTVLGAFAGLGGGNDYAITGGNNTLVGVNSRLGAPTITNATAIGANALVGESNAVVLGYNANVGIGTTAPGATLEVDGSNQLDVFIKAPESGVGAGLDFFTTGSGGLQWEILDTGSGASQGANKLNIRNVTGGTDVLTIVASGVGIGTTSPDNTLTVNGSADKPGGGSWGTYSDGRLKNLNGSFSSGLSQVLKLHPIRYRYKADNAMGIRDTDEHVGVVAQDVRRVIPEAVTENSKGYLLVNNDPVMWAMVNAIKEQQREIQQQQAELAKALRQVKQQQSLFRAQSSAMRSLEAEVRETRESLRKVKAQVAASQLTVVAKK
jgi:hypothetical protein